MPKTKKLDAVDRLLIGPYVFRRENKLHHEALLSETECVSHFASAGAETECECGERVFVDYPMHTECKCGRIYYWDLQLKVAMGDENWAKSKYRVVVEARDA